MAIVDDLQMAVQAERDGRTGRRDALLTLAAAGAPADADWLAICRSRLLRSRPDHIFAAYSTISTALAAPEVSRAVIRLRASYPEAKVRWLALREAARRGPWTGRSPGVLPFLNDLLGRERPARRTPEAIRGLGNDEDGRYYLRVLMSVAFLLESLRTERREDLAA